MSWYNAIFNKDSKAKIMKFFRWVPDKTMLKMQYLLKFGKRLNLKNPRTFNEKIQWLKLYDRKPEYTVMVDKYEAKKYIADIIGEQYVIPTLGVWDSFDDIDFDALPDSFVIKCTHDSGGLVICRDKSKLDLAAARKKIEKCFKNNYYHTAREWPYKDVKPRIIAEPYLVDESGVELKDYKIFCCNGVAKYIEVDFNRHIVHKLNPYDFDWNPLNFCDKSKNDYGANIPKPKRLEDIRSIAEKLSANMTFLRVDFYSIDEQIYVGELTLYPGGGFVAFEPEEWDLKIGEWITLPNENI